jgi:hypothetical protein
MSAVPPQGSEARTSILPSMVPSGLGFFGSPYKPADAMPTPSQIGVRAGDSMSDVVNAVKGVGYYIDQIGFGAPSTGLTQGMGLKPLGVNYFINTGAKCSNGAEMWTYMQGIPEGNALGDRVQQAMSDMGMPALRGLAPGMLEDVQNGLNPAPLMNSLLGSGYPECEQVEKMVGDLQGNIADPSSNEAWIADLETAYKKGDGLYYQKRWVQRTVNGKKVDLTRDQWVETKKTFNPDGTPIKEAFEATMTHPGTVITVGILCLLAFAFVRKNK